MSSARCWSFTPGRFTTTVSPWRMISGSATPIASTRERMISTATSSATASYSPSGCNVIDAPPCKSRPSDGASPLATVKPTETTATSKMPISDASSRRFIQPRATLFNETPQQLRLTPGCYCLSLFASESAFVSESAFFDFFGALAALGVTIGVPSRLTRLPTEPFITCTCTPSAISTHR